ncbi:MAG: hypothetical protein PWQ31_667 [Eubacteriales bacterium]|nr:hypothetical protein [Eubacteriales bacterium]
MARKKKLVVFVFALFLSLVLATGTALADTSRVLTFGADLTAEQREEMARFFGVPNYREENIPVLEVTNQEERATLKGMVPESAIGTRAVSCAFVEVLSPGSGITVETKNITYVTKEMYASALTTAGVKDARVMAAAPFPVSGTAALTGMFKAFEKATGKSLSPQAKVIANEELVQMGKLGEAIGDKNKAAQLMMRVKEQVVADKIKDPEQIRQIVIDVGRDLNINLTPQQIDQITELMRKISTLDLTARDISAQLKNIKLEMDKFLQENQEVKSLLRRILDAISAFIEKIKAWLGL